MSKLLLIIVALAFANVAAAGENDICRNQGYGKKLLRKCKKICVKLDCDSEIEAYTNKRCVRKVDSFMRLSEGELPPCIPKYQDGFLKNEIYCYANWKALTEQECDPLFDSEKDVYGEVDESNGISEYEICSMNAIAQFDSCLVAIELQATQSCFDLYDPCYEEYDITSDYDLLSTCLEKLQTEYNACGSEVQESFYFQF